MTDWMVVIIILVLNCGWFAYTGFVVGRSVGKHETLNQLDKAGPLLVLACKRYLSDVDSLTLKGQRLYFEKSTTCCLMREAVAAAGAEGIKMIAGDN